MQQILIVEHPRPHNNSLELPIFRQRTPV
jgi:hypothetical protein